MYYFSIMVINNISVYRIWNLDLQQTTCAINAGGRKKNTHKKTNTPPKTKKNFYKNVYILYRPH
jgi:hypothetical protein